MHEEKSIDKIVKEQRALEKLKLFNREIAFKVKELQVDEIWFKYENNIKETKRDRLIEYLENASNALEEEYNKEQLDRKEHKR